MNIKKLLSITPTLLIITTSVFAGGPEYVPTYAGIYFEGGSGYAIHDWSGTESPVSPYAPVNIPAPFNLSSSVYTYGGFTAVLDLGYQIMKYVSIEGGWIYLPYPQGTFLNLTTLVPYNVSIRSWIAYAAEKTTLPIGENFSFFFKIGGAYNYNRVSGAGLIPAGASTPTTTAKYWQVLVAPGLQYYFNPNVSMSLQYTYVPGYSGKSSNIFQTPNVQIISLSIGYKILI